MSNKNIKEGFPYNVDHMHGAVIRNQPADNCTTCHGRKVMYKTQDGNLYADNKINSIKMKCPTCKGTGSAIKKEGIKGGIAGAVAGGVITKTPGGAMAGYNIGSDLEDAFTEGSMGGINRSRPSHDVSYEKVLDEVIEKWHQDLEELGLDTLNQYRKAVTSPEVVRTRPLRKLAKSVIGYKQASDKVSAKTGDRSGSKPKFGPINAQHGKTYEERLSEILGEDDFGDIVKKQRGDEPKPGQTIDKAYNGWVIRYQLSPKVAGQPVQWMTWHSKKSPETAKRGSAATSAQAFQDATAFINSGAGEDRKFNTSASNVHINFNTNFSQEIIQDNSSFYATIDDGHLIISLVPQKGLKKAFPRLETMSKEPFWEFNMSTNSAIDQRLVPNGRYTLGKMEKIDDDTFMFSIHFQSVAQDSRDKMRMGTPGFTVAVSREVEEACWKNYKQIGMKDKGGKKVPNCVPKESLDQSAEYNDEAGMADNNLETLRRAVEGIDSLISPGDNLPEWCQEIIAVAKADLVTVWDYMKSEQDKVDEEYKGPWHGDPEKLKKAPKSYMQGKEGVTMSDLVQDTIRAHGVRDAFEFYVLKHGMPPREFRIFSGI